MESESNQQQHAEAAEEAMAMAAAAATSAVGTPENKDKGKRIWIPDEGPSNPTDDLMLDIDGDDLIFSDEAFSCLPDFPCLAAPAGSPSSSSACNLFNNTSLASSSSSSSSFLFAPDGGGSGGGDLQAVASSSNCGRMMRSEVASDLLSMELEGLDILGDIGLFDLSEQWDPASLIPDNMTMNGAATASASGQEPSLPLHAMAGEERPPGEAGVVGGAATGAPFAGPEEDPEEMARVFFEWMRINRDAISPQDLRQIRMKRATIDCAVRHLGGNRQAKVQLLKLVLTWVQANHLQKKKRRRGENEQQDRPEGVAQPPYPYNQQQPFAPPNHHVPVMSSDVTANPNPNLDYSYDADSQRNGWIPYHLDPTTGAAFPVMMPVYVGGGGGSTSGGEPAYPGVAAAAAAPFSYHQGSTSSIVLNGQPFSPSPDLHAADHTAAAWPSQYTAAPAQYVPFPGAAGSHPAPMPQAQYPGGFVNQYPGHPLYQQGQQVGGMASATKEARKKRMARQRRASSLHHHRSQQQQLQNHHQAESSSSRAPAEGGSSSSSNANANNNNNNNNNNNRTWGFWSSSSSSRQKNPMMEAPPPPKSSMQQPQLSPSMPPQQQQQQQQNSHRDDAASTADRRQGLKGEKNLRFLLQKVLKQSDVGSLGRIVLPKKEAEIHLPELDTRDGISIPMEDIGTSQVWNMRYRFWPNNKSRMYLLENTGEFVRSNGLQEGDFIVIYSDIKCGKYMIRGVKVRPQTEKGQASRSVARSHLKRSNWERGSTSRMRGSSGHDGINDDLGMPSSSTASPFVIKRESSP
ncbi:regulatory protein viviparous-1 [Phoenix dactylifera]|uniref:Regulatory protein viviparous-1 n=1 Tax=Phoenix dactylifera TaxID=42345 RepID=A0A8B9APH7_PHODC|nr:regulatory protein viviparous-1 [Phoenix dactylifera]